MTHPIKGIVAVSAAALYLSGCDSLFSSNTSDSTTPPPSGVTPGPSYDTQFIAFNDLSFEIGGVSRTPADQIPSSGAVNYTGVVGFSTDAPASGIQDYDMLSDLSLRADFSTGAVTGTMQNFNARGNTAMNGNLTLTEGRVLGTNFTANAIGSFSDGTTAEIWDLDVVADFMGAGGTSIEGTANGTISNGGSVNTDVFGDMIATRN